MDKIIIPNPKSSRKGQTYTLPTMNEYTLANRTNYHIGAQMKKKAQDHISYHLVLVPPITERVTMHFIWYEERMNRDPDNICSARKFILDAMQEAGVLENDGWKQIKGFTDRFEVDKGNPRVEIEVEYDKDRTGVKSLD